MKEVLENTIWEFICKYCDENKINNIWETPIVKFADAKNPLFNKLKELVYEEHYVPSDYLPNATIVVSYFLPFKTEVGQSNVANIECSYEWADAYIKTNKMAVEINKYLVEILKEQNIHACSPTNAGMISEQIPKSRWSQRHIAFIAGHGTFGLNNMLISEKGCVGRYFSIITALDVEADKIKIVERCIYKKTGKCQLCVKRCPAGALTVNGFNRFRCLEQCMKNDERYKGADVCGKCVVGLPCSR